MVTEQELRDLCKKHRWTLRDGLRSGDQKVYTAVQRQGERTVSRYIATAGRLAAMTEDDVIEKLNRPSRGQEVGQGEHE